MNHTITRRSLVALTSAFLAAGSRTVVAQTPVRFNDVAIAHGESRWKITAGELEQAVATADGDGTAAVTDLDQERVAALLQPIADELVVTPKDAVVGWRGGLYVIEEGSPGRVVDMPALVELVIAAARGSDSVVRVPFEEVSPEVHSGNLDSLGITSLLGEGASSFAGSSWERAENVRVGAVNVDQTLIPPHSMFSFNAALGPITPDMGYVEGKIIRDGWFQGDIGGGVCQVSTTVYRAAFYSGLNFGEVHPHSFRLAFYELEGWPPGIDAAIYQPNADHETAMDLTFENPTDSWMLLQLSLGGEELHASIYGPDLGYETTVGEPYISDPIEPDEPVEQKDPSLEPGQVVAIQEARPGYNVEIQRTVARGEEIVSDRWFKSFYRPQRETWAVGV